MQSLYLLIPVALIICAVAIKFLLWAIDNGQYDDLDKEAWRILGEDDNDKAPTQTPRETPAAEEHDRGRPF